MQRDTIQEIRKPIQAEFRQYEQAFADALQTDNKLLSEVLDYIHSKRGKQLRPILVMLSAAVCRGITDKTLQTAVVDAHNNIYLIGGQSFTETFSDVYRGHLTSIDW